MLHLKSRLVLRIVLIVGMLGATALALGSDRRSAEAQAPIDNLIINGSMEDGFYWKYPNHFVANNWFRWWTDGSVLPEYDDTRTARPHYDGERAQVYFKWGNSYQAGMYQVIENVTPCAYYELAAYARNHSVEDALPHARIGLDPDGTQLTSSENSGAVKTGLPPRTVWSWEQTQLDVWEQLKVTAEATGPRMTAILYASPQPVRDQVHFYDTYWDAVTLYQLPFPDGRLPEPSDWTPSGFITNIATPVVAGNNLLLEWDTLEPALSQATYTVTSSLEPVTPTETLSHTLFIPVMISHRPPLPISGPTTHHTALIPHVSSGHVVEVVLLVRRSDGTACRTEASAPITFAIP